MLTKAYKLKLELAAMLDMRVLVSTTYKLEGDRLELLLVHEYIEDLRRLGASLKAGGDGVLANLDAALRADTKLRNDVKIKKV